MDVTDFAIGLVLIGILVWVSIVALNQSSIMGSIADLYAISIVNRPLISVQEACPRQSGFELVQPERLEMEPYHVLSGSNDYNQTYFCFYRKVGQEITEEESA